MTRLVDLSPAVHEGFKGPPSTDVGVQFDVRVKAGYWQSARAALSCQTWAQQAIGTPRYFPESPALAVEAARWLVERRPKCVGCDFFEEPAARAPGWVPEDFVVHRTLLGAGIVLVEGLVNLHELPPRCEFFASFYKFAGIDAAPARAFARVGE